MLVALVAVLGVVAGVLGLELARVGRRLAAERARLADAEQRLLRLADASSDVVAYWRHRPEPHFAWISPALRTVVGVEPEAAVARPGALLDEVFPRDLPALTAALADPSAVEQPLLVRWFRQDGNLAWTEVTFAPARDADGRLDGVDVTAHDVTARMLTLEEREDLVHSLSHERAWLTAVLEHSPVGMLLVPGRDEPVVPNASAIALLGDDLDWSLGPDVCAGRLGWPDGRPLTPEELPGAAALRGERVLRQELVVFRGEERTPVWVHAAPVATGTGHTGAVVLLEDVTALKHLERTREEWTSIVAHDLRQPIQGIMGMAGLLAKRPSVEPELAEKLRGIDRAARRLSGMVSDLLDASRLDVRQLALDRKEVAPEPLIRDMVDRLRAAWPDRRIELDVDAPPPRVRVDPGRLEQVVSNLVSNALRYGAPGTPVRIHVAGRGDELHLAVTNEGEGIAPEELGQLFRRFSRTRTGRRAGSGGIGLGLYISHGLVAAHGGRLTAESVPGGTTTFRVALPAEPPTT